MRPIPEYAPTKHVFPKRVRQQSMGISKPKECTGELQDAET
jgi:hypothetical protein